MPKTQKIAVAYLRVSTEAQGKTGYGFELQEASVRAWAHHQDYQIIQVYHDIHTGMGKTSFRDRPGVMQALEAAKANMCPIIVDQLDRFCRNVEGLKAMIDRKAINVISAREDVGTSRAAVLSTAARAQRHGELISESTKRALKERKARGILLGNRTNLPEARAKGLAKVQERVNQQVDELAPVIEELRRSGRTTAGAIADGLNECGYRTARSNLWNAGNIRRLLDRIRLGQDEQGTADEATSNPTQKAPQMASRSPWASASVEGQSHRRRWPDTRPRASQAARALCQPSSLGSLLIRGR